MIIKSISRETFKIKSGLNEYAPRGGEPKLNNDLILLVGMVDSPHFQRWVKILRDLFPEKKIYVFPSDRPKIKKFAEDYRDSSIGIFRIFSSLSLNFGLFYLMDLILGMKWRSYVLARLLIQKKPAILHFHEMQHAAYIFNPIANIDRIPRNIKKIVSTWGSDLIYYSWSDSDSLEIDFCLEWIDLLTAERQEDLPIAKKYGYGGAFIAPVYITVGSESQIASMTRPSDRNLILVKGYQDNTGRALNVLAALKAISAELKPFQIKVFSASEPVRYQVDLMRNKLGIDIKVIPRVEKAVLKDLFGKARVYIGLSESDGAPSSMIEAMESGCFPIQSQNSAGYEFIQNSVSGFIVDPWNLEAVQSSISIALNRNELVDRAADLNKEKLIEVYDLEKGKKRMKEIYLI